MILKNLYLIIKLILNLINFKFVLNNNRKNRQSNFLEINSRNSTDLGRVKRILRGEFEL